MITNIGSKLDEVRTWILSLSGVSALFPSGLFVGKPVKKPSGAYAYFELASNSPYVGNDRTGTTHKRATLQFVIASGKKSAPDVELYETLDALANAVCTNGKEPVQLSGIRILNIDESNQSGVFRDVDECPALAAQFTAIYESQS